MYSKLVNNAVDGVLQTMAQWRAQTYRPKSEWFRFYASTGARIEAYMRYEFFRLPEGRMAECITIANISATPQQRGIGTGFIAGIHVGNPCEFTCIENIHNEHLRKWAQAHGWLAGDSSWSDGICCSFHRPTGNPAVVWPFARSVVVVPAPG